MITFINNKNFGLRSVCQIWIQQQDEWGKPQALSTIHVTSFCTISSAKLYWTCSSVNYLVAEPERSTYQQQNSALDLFLRHLCLPHTLPARSSSVLDLTFSQQWLYGVLSSGMWRCVVQQKATHISEEHTASTVRTDEYTMQETSAGRTSIKPHSITIQKAVVFILMLPESQSSKISEFMVSHLRRPHLNNRCCENLKSQMNYCSI